MRYHPVGRSPEEQLQWERAIRCAQELTGSHDPSRSLVNAMYDFVRHDDNPKNHTDDFEAKLAAEARERERLSTKASAREILPRRRAQLDMFAGASA